MRVRSMFIGYFFLHHFYSLISANVLTSTFLYYTEPTSKRTTTRMREGIKKKASAHRRKEAKNAKKNPQWKSKKPKDLGIPSSFPYKEDILNEIENKRQANLEERERRKLAKQQEAAARASDYNEGMMDIEEGNSDNDASNGLAALVESAQQAAREFDGELVENEMMDQDEDEYEVEDLDVDEILKGKDLSYMDDEDQVKDNQDSDKSMKAFNKFFKAVVDASDVILYVLDARDPEGTRSKRVEEQILNSKDHKKLIFLLNKVDMVPNDVVNKWVNYYKNKFPTIPVKGSSSSSISVAHNFNKNLSQSVTASALMTSLKSYANKSDLKRSIVVGVVGFPNVGKSSIINALTSKHSNLAKKVCPVGNMPGVTTSLREVKVDNKLKIIDSPGIVFPPPIKNSANLKKLKLQQDAKLTLLNALPLKLIKDPTLAIQLLLKRLQKNEDSFATFNNYYGIPSMPYTGDIEDFTRQILIHVARSRGRLGKGGIPNLHAASLCILNDWKDGRFVGWTVPPENKQLEVEINKDTTIKVKGKVDNVTIVQQWSKEFDLDSLFASAGIDTSDDA